jgi:hypothetical protein
MKNLKVQVDYFIDINLVGKRVKKTSDKDIYRPDYVKIVAKRCKIYEG